MANLKRLVSHLESSALESEVVFALSQIGEYGSRATIAIDAVRKILRHENLTVRSYAAHTLGLIGGHSPEAVSDLLDAWDQDRLPYALLPLGSMNSLSAPACERVMAIVENDATTSIVKRTALLALGGCNEPSPQIRDVIMRSLRDPLLSDAAATVLSRLVVAGRLERQDAATAMTSVLSTASQENKIGIAIAILKFDPDNKSSIDVLKHALSTADGFSAALTLVELGHVGEEVAKVLVAEIANEDESTEAEAAIALSRIAGYQTVAMPALVRGLGHEFDNVQIDCVNALGRLGTIAASAVPALERLRVDPNVTERLREQAGEALALIRGSK